MPFPWAAVIPAAASLVGGLISNRNNRNIADQNAELQREFAQHGIKWKVQDAKEAGLHPLFGLTGTTASFSPVTFSDALGPAVSDAGSQVGSYLANEQRRRDEKRERSIERQVQMDQIILGQQRLRSQIHVDTAQANYYNALAADVSRKRNGAGATPAFGVTSDPDTISTQQGSGLVQVVPPEIKTHDPGNPSIEAGTTRPLWVIEDAGRGLKSVRMNEEAAEAWGDLVAPIINAAATAYYYTFKTLPKVTKQNYRWLLEWHAKQRASGRPDRTLGPLGYGP